MRFIGVIIALALALVAGIAVLKFSNNTSKQQEVLVDPKPQDVTVPTTMILVARRDIPVGTEIKDSSFFDQQPWPKHLVLDQFITADQAPKVIRTVTRSNFLAREPLILSKLANKDDPSFLASSLPEGMRVVTIGTDAISGLAGFVFPGDRVDVLYTHELDEPARPQNGGDQDPAVARQDPKKVTEVLVMDAKVLAVDQKAGVSSADKVTAPTSVSLEVTQVDAQKIRLAEKKGYLALALRPLKDKDVKTVISPTEESSLTQAAPEEVGKLARPIVVVRGVKVEVLRNTTNPASAQEPEAAPFNSLMNAPATEGNR